MFLIDYQSTRRADCRNKKGEDKGEKVRLVVLHTVGFHKYYNSGNNHVMSIKSRNWFEIVNFLKEI